MRAIVGESGRATPSTSRTDLPRPTTPALSKPIAAVDRRERRPSSNIPPTVPRLSETRQADVVAFASPLIFDSHFAGLLFLLNAFTRLKLFPDFASEGPSMLAVSPLWLIDRIGCFRFGRRYGRDPLHAWIAANSCRGALPENWTVDPAWPRSWRPGDRPFVVERGNRLTVWDPRGFPIADMPAAFRHRSSAGRSRTRIVLRYHRRAARTPRLPVERSERWVACLAYFLDARIRLATGDPAVGLDALAQSGQMVIDELDVTAHFSFEPQTVPLRRAGLDRDPCWQPAECRSFRFRFS
jgi:hypothetical protein